MARIVGTWRRESPELDKSPIWQIKATKNKSSVLFSTAAMHLDFLLRTFGERGLVIFCDQQGGRAHYGHLLRMMFEEWSLEIVREGNGYAEYHLLRCGHTERRD